MSNSTLPPPSSGRPTRAELERVALALRNSKRKRAAEATEALMLDLYPDNRTPGQRAHAEYQRTNRHTGLSVDQIWECVAAEARAGTIEAARVRELIDQPDRLRELLLTVRR